MDSIPKRSHTAPNNPIGLLVAANNACTYGAEVIDAGSDPWYST